MLSININIQFIILLTTIVKIQCLVKLAILKSNNNIGNSEQKTWDTMNKLFNTLKVQNAKPPKFFPIHKHLIPEESTSLNKVVESINNDIDKSTNNFITKINEILQECNKSNNVDDSDVLLDTYIETFVGKLKFLREKYVQNTVRDTKVFKNPNIKGGTLVNVAEVIENVHTKTTLKDELLPENLINNSENWTSSGRRIFKGIRTRIKDFPFVASVQFFKKFQCAGSIIKNDLVITAASCLQLAWNNRFYRENPAFISVQIGSDLYEYGGENIDVQEIYFYPSYDPKTLQHNLAIMRLSRKISFRKNQKRVRKIDIARSPSPLSSINYITIVGWGARDASNIISNIHHNRLSYADLDVYPLSECRDVYGKKFVTKRNFCGGFFSKGSGACNRDVGGPAVVDYTLVGVISFGTAVCGTPDSPTVFTKLGYYADWIDEIIEQEVPSTYKRTTTIEPTYFSVTFKPTKNLEIMPITKKMKPKVRNPQTNVNDFLVSEEIKQMIKTQRLEPQQKKNARTPGTAVTSRTELKMWPQQFTENHDNYTTPIVNKITQQDYEGESSDEETGLEINKLINVSTQNIANNDEITTGTEITVLKMWPQRFTVNHYNYTTPVLNKVTQQVYYKGESSSSDEGSQTDTDSVNDPPPEDTIDLIKTFTISSDLPFIGTQLYQEQINNYSSNEGLKRNMKLHKEYTYNLTATLVTPNKLTERDINKFSENQQNNIKTEKADVIEVKNDTLSVKEDINALIDGLDLENLLDKEDNSRNDNMTHDSTTNKDKQELQKLTTTKQLVISRDKDTLRVPAKPSQNVTITELPKTIDLDKISRSMVYEVVALIVEDELQKQRFVEKLIQKSHHYLI